MPKRTDISSILIIGAGPIVIGQACEFDYSGTQACKALKAEGYRIVLVNSNPATIMTDPGPRRRHLYRADHPRDRRQDHREGAPGRAPAHHGGTDRAQLRAVAAQDGGARQVQRPDDRRHRRRHRHGGGSRAVPRGDGAHRPGDAALAPHQDAVGGARGARGYRAARHHPAVLHARRHRRRHRLQQGRVHRDRGARHRRLAHQRGAGRGSGARLEGIRDGGRSRPERQLHHHLLDREPGPDGGAYRRFHHRRAGA